MSHFSTIKTKLKETEPLIKALNQLGYTPSQDEKFVKGFQGKYTAVDISLDLPQNTKVGSLFASPVDGGGARKRQSDFLVS